ncbi:MAG TPA: hypothetical protein VFO49_02050 [Nocardioides sp.]|nr:hypothetical protein [Nocardioides sp.]
MTPLKRYVGGAGAAVLLAFSLTACGGAPSDASTEDFCDAFNSSADIFADIDPEADPADQAGDVTDGYKEFADKLEEVGTPENISDDAREGFEIFVEELGDLNEDDVEKYLEDPSEDIAEVSEDDEKKVDEFTEYAAKECGAPEE